MNLSRRTRIGIDMLDVIATSSDHHGISVPALATTLQLSRAVVKSIADDLAKAHLITRSGNRRRRLQLQRPLHLITVADVALTTERNGRFEIGTATSRDGAWTFVEQRIFFALEKMTVAQCLLEYRTPRRHFN